MPTPEQVSVFYVYVPGDGWVALPADVVRMYCYTNVKFTRRKPVAGDRFVKVPRLTKDPEFEIMDQLKSMYYSSLPQRKAGVGNHPGFIYFVVEQWP